MIRSKVWPGASYNRRELFADFAYAMPQPPSFLVRHHYLGLLMLLLVAGCMWPVAGRAQGAEGENSALYFLNPQPPAKDTESANPPSPSSPVILPNAAKPLITVEPRIPGGAPDALDPSAAAMSAMQGVPPRRVSQKIAIDAKYFADIKGETFMLNDMAERLSRITLGFTELYLLINSLPDKSFFDVGRWFNAASNLPSGFLFGADVALAVLLLAVLLIWRHHMTPVESVFMRTEPLPSPAKAMRQDTPPDAPQKATSAPSASPLSPLPANPGKPAAAPASALLPALDLRRVAPDARDASTDAPKIIPAAAQPAATVAAFAEEEFGATAVASKADSAPGATTAATLAPVIINQPAANANGRKFSADKDAVIEFADVMLRLGIREGATQSLLEHIRKDPQGSLFHWLKLLEIVRTSANAEEFANVANDFRRYFNIQAQEADSAADERSLDSYRHVMNKIIALWANKEECMAYLQSLLENNRKGARTGFPQVVADDILLLLGVLELRA